MATYRGQGTDSFSIGAAPPTVLWTVVRGDTAAFRVYVTDDAKAALDLATWTIDLEIRRGGNLIVSLAPQPVGATELGYFVVTLLPDQSEILETEDVFDIQLSDASRTWTICKGTITVIEDVTAAES